MKPLILALVLCQSATLAFAQTAPAPAAKGMAAGPGSFVCGGIGSDEREKLRAAAASHDLLLSFAATGGGLVAGVDVEIRKGSQVVLQGHCAGAEMLANVGGKGSYQVRVVHKGKEQRRTVNVDRKPARVTFFWPDRS